jgi:hypothetical protein
LSDLAYPIATYKVLDGCCSVIKAEKYLYLGGEKNLHIFEVTTSLIQPLIPIKVINTESLAFKILRVGDKLILAEVFGYLEVFDINNSSIIHTH